MSQSVQIHRQAEQPLHWFQILSSTVFKPDHDSVEMEMDLRFPVDVNMTCIMSFSPFLALVISSPHHKKMHSERI